MPFSPNHDGVGGPVLCFIEEDFSRISAIDKSVDVESTTLKAGSIFGEHPRYPGQWVFISRVDPFLQVEGRFEDRGDDLLIDGRDEPNSGAGRPVTLANGVDQETRIFRSVESKEDSGRPNTQLTGTPADTNRAGGFDHDLLGDAAESQPAQPGATSCTNNDQVSLPVGGPLDDRPAGRIGGRF